MPRCSTKGHGASVRTTKRSEEEEGTTSLKRLKSSRLDVTHALHGCNRMLRLESISHTCDFGEFQKLSTKAFEIS